MELQRKASKYENVLKWLTNLRLFCGFIERRLRVDFDILSGFVMSLLRILFLWADLVSKTPSKILRDPTIMIRHIFHNFKLYF